MNSFHNRSRYASQAGSPKYYLEETEDLPQYETSAVDETILTLDIKEQNINQSTSPKDRRKLLGKFIYSEKK